MDLLQRMRATQKTVDRFKGQLLVWGTYDCGQMVVRHAAYAGIKIKLPRYGDRESAAAVMKQMGWRTLADAMDEHFQRLEPAKVLMGDIVEMPGGGGFSALTVAVGNGRVLGFHEDIPHADILQPLLISGAWTLG